MNSKKHKIINSKNGAKASVTQNATDDNEEDSKNSPGKALVSNSADAMVYFYCKNLVFCFNQLNPLCSRLI